MYNHDHSISVELSATNGKVLYRQSSGVSLDFLKQGLPWCVFVIVMVSTYYSPV